MGRRQSGSIGLGQGASHHAEVVRSGRTIEQQRLARTGRRKLVIVPFPAPSSATGRFAPRDKSTSTPSVSMIVAHAILGRAWLLP